MTDPLYVLAGLALIVAISEWLVRKTALRHLGTALVVILVTAVAANTGIMPSYSDGVPIYDGIFKYVAPLAIFWLLLRVSLQSVIRAGRAMMSLFLLGSLGTFVGVLVGMRVVGGQEAFGSDYAALAGMFVGTYTGGSINFNAIALEYGVVEDGLLYAGATAIDSLMTTVWMALTIALPRLMGGAKADQKSVHAAPTEPLLGVEDDTEAVHPVDIAWLLALGAASVWLAGIGSEYLEQRLGLPVPSILIITSIALVLAHWRPVAELAGSRTLGMFAVYLFLAVIGALCDVGALSSIGSLGLNMLAFVSVALCVHGLIIFGGARLFKIDPAVAAVASQANVGGGTSALALARSLARPDLVLPAILVGALGTAIGTYLGVMTVILLG
jgi:uncharacterized membrane protein